MTFDAQVRAVADLGFTRRQAGFLVQVLRHAGVCLPRQYCDYATIARGQKTHDFFGRLVARRYATPYLARNGRTRVYHLQNKVLYRAIGDPETRLRRSQALDRAVERLMVLDHLLTERDVHWLAGEHEKVAHFTRTAPLRPEELPSLTFDSGTDTTTRYFPDRLPIGVAPDGRHIFLYVVSQDVPLDFRGFLHRHGELLRAVPEWEVRLLTPGPLEESRPGYEEAFRDELARPLTPSVVDELAWYFRELRARSVSDESRFRVARRRFGAPRYRGLYRAWRVTGDRVLHATASGVLADAVARGRGRLDYRVPAHRYAQLTPLVGRFRDHATGNEGGNTV